MPAIAFVGSAEPPDVLGRELRRRRHRDRRPEVGVVGDPHGDAAVARLLERVDDELL